MRIIINDENDANMRLRLPTGLVLNPVSALFLRCMLKKKGIAVSRRLAIIFVKSLRDYKREHPEWRLVEMESAAGEHLQIML